MNKDPHAVHKTTLAGGDLCQLEHCADGDVVHAHVGHASLRLTPSGFFALRATLLEAPRRMERQSGMLRLPVHTGLPDCGEQYIHDRTVMAVDKKSKETHREMPTGRVSAPKRVNSEALMGDRKELIIEHAGREYVLRITQNGKLILTA